MRASRPLVAAAAALLLAGCGLEKSTPIVSVVSGGEFEHTEASLYCFEGQDPAREPGSPGGCSTAEHVAEIEVQPGAQVGINVAKEVADGHWVASILSQGEGGQGGTSSVQDEHYFSFSAPQFPPGDQSRLVLEVRRLSAPEAQSPPTGIWRFLLRPAD